MKKLLLLALLLSSTASAVTIVSSDGKEIQLSDELARLSGAIAHQLEAMGEPSKPIRFVISKEAKVSSATLKFLIEAMVELKAAQRNAAPEARKYDLIIKIKFEEVKTIPQMIDVLKAANHLDIELVGEAAAHRLAQQLTHKGPTLIELMQHLPGELQQMVGKHYAIVYKVQMPELGFVPSVSLDDVLEYSKERGQSFHYHIDLKKRHITNLGGIEKLALKYPNLDWLTLDDNRLGSLPPQIGELKKLETLTLARNQLKSLPPQIGQLKKLKMLILDKNQLASLPPEIEQLEKLESLDLTDNKLVSLPPQIAQLPRLEKVYLDGNPIPASEIARIKRALPNTEILTD